MGLDADTYGTVARIERLVGDLVQARVFTSTSVPSLAQVEGWLDDVASELNSSLTFAEYTVPVTVAADKAAFNYLAHGNSCGAAVLVLDSLPAESYTEPGEETPAQGRKQSLQIIFRRLLKAIMDEKLPASRATGGEFLAPLAIGSSTDGDGNKKLPIFKRGKTDFPSSRSLTE